MDPLTARSTLPDTPILIIKMDGGVVQGTVTNVPGLEVLVLDYEVMKPDATAQFPEQDGELADASAYFVPPLVDPPYARKLMDICEAARQESAPVAAEA